jgi:deoxyribose-phosphate aldolase
MKIDFAIIDTDKNEAEIKDLISKILSMPIKVNTITCSMYYVKLIKSLVQQYGIKVSCLVDFPLGISDLKTRKFATEQACSNGADMVDIMMPQNLASNRKYDKIREDTKILSDYTKEVGMDMRYILEYRVFDHHCLKKLCEIINNHNIKYVFPSTGYFLDNLADNLIASVFLYENSKEIFIYCTGNSWKNNQFNIIEKTGLYGIRLMSVSALKNFVDLLVEKQQNPG